MNLPCAGFKNELLFFHYTGSEVPIIQLISMILLCAEFESEIIALFLHLKKR